MQTPLPALILHLILTLKSTAASPAKASDPLTGTEIALVNFYAPGASCTGPRAPERLIRNACYSPAGPVGFKIAAIVAVVEGSRCQVVGYATEDCSGVGEALSGGACYDGGVEAAPASMIAVCGSRE